MIRKAGEIGIVIVGTLLTFGLAVADLVILSAAVAPPTPQWHWYVYIFVRFCAIIAAGGIVFTLLLIRLFGETSSPMRNTTPAVRCTH